MQIRRSIAIVLCLLLGPVPAVAHELWIEPLKARVEPEGRIEAHLVNGETFTGQRLPYLTGDIRRLTLHMGAEHADLAGRLGDIPAISAPPLGEGLHVIAYESAPRTLRYTDFERFVAFADHKDLGDVAAMTAARGLGTESITEVYSRHSKALLPVGHGRGSDRRLGLETEFVALDPLQAGQPMRLQLFGPDGPRAAVQVELFVRAPSGAVDISLLTTDSEGIVTLTPAAGHDYMADAVILRVPTAERAAETGTDTAAHWETLWANLVLRLP